MRIRQFLYLGLILFNFFLIHPLFAKESGVEKDWVPDDVLRLERASSFHISPCGKWVVWVKASPDKEENKYLTHIFLSSLEEKREIQLTRGKSSESSPKFSPDGKKIAFLSDREKKNQIYVIELPGGEPLKLTEMEKGVNSWDWVDEKTIFFTAPEDKTHREKKLEKEKDDTVVVADQEHYGPVRLFKLELETKKITRLTSNDYVITEFAVSPCRRFVVTNESQSVDWEFDMKVPPKQFLYDLDTGLREEIFPEPRIYPFGFQWTRDGKGFYCFRALSSDPEDTFVSVMTLVYYDFEERNWVDVNLDWERYLSFFGSHITEEGILVSLANGVKVKWAIYRKTGPKTWSRSFLENEKADNFNILALQEKGQRVIYAYSTASTPEKYSWGELQGNRISEGSEFLELNGFLKHKNIAKTEIIRWKGARGDEVEGILYYPHDYQAGKKYPLVPIIHGGPAGTDMDRFEEHYINYPNLLASKGAFSLMVNYHGSAGYGLEWVESIKKRYYEYEVPDILSGIDYLIQRGLVDPERVGIMGWSNGSILSIACCLERPNFFKALCAGAGDVNWISDYGNVSFGHAWGVAYFGGPPWENLDYFIKISPLFRLKENTTPTIIFFGSEDVNVPTEQGWEHFRALQQIGKVPVRFLLFPGEPHVFEKLSHMKRKIEEEMAWFDKYLFKIEKKENEAFNPDSPLALALKKARASRWGELLGERKNGVLIPEVVRFKNLMVGRFEVTRAQFKEFKKDYPFDPARANFPASNVSYEEATKYCQWLERKTGKKFRLLKEKEMAELLELAEGKKENNLDYWAGYSPTPDEVRLLEEKIFELEKQGSLLREVGSMEPEGEFYDFGGNVSEWCTTEKGEKKIMGLCAISPGDPKARFTPPCQNYVGFRVCYEER